MFIELLFPTKLKLTIIFFIIIFYFIFWRFSFMKKKGITPGNGASYSLKQYMDAIAKEIKLKKPATIICNNDEKGTEQLFEVRLCTNKEV